MKHYVSLGLWCCAGVLLFLFVIRCSPEDPPEHKIILVGPLKSSGDRAYDYLGHGIAAEIVHDVRALADPRTEALGRYVLRYALKELGLLNTPGNEDHLRQAARVLGANFICTGEVSVVEERFDIRLRLSRVDPPELRKEFTVSGSLAELDTGLDQVLVKLMEQDSPWWNLLAQDETLAATIRKRYRPELSAFHFFARGLDAELNWSSSKAREFFRQAATLAPDYAEALAAEAWIAFLHEGDFEKSTELYTLAEEALENRGESQSLAMAAIHASRGLYLNRSRRFPESIAAYRLSREIHERLGRENTAVYFTVLNDLGVVLAFHGQPEAALELYKIVEAGEQSLGRENSNDYAHLQASIGRAWSRKEIYFKALKAFEKSRAIKEALGLTGSRGYATLLFDMAFAKYQENQKEAALEDYKKSRALQEELGLQSRPIYKSTLANIKILSGHLERLKNFKESLRSAE